MLQAPFADIELTESIYDSLRQPKLIRDIMGRFARTMGCDAAYLKIVDQTAGEVLIGAGGGAPEGSDRDYLDNYLETDVRVPRVNNAPRGTILDDRQLISADEMRRSAFHHEFLPRYDLGYLAHVNLARSPRFTTIVTCAQAPQRGEFNQQQIRTFAFYIPHFEQSCELYLRLRDLGGYAALMAAAFESGRGAAPGAVARVFPKPAQRCGRGAGNHHRPAVRQAGLPAGGSSAAADQRLPS